MSDESPSETEETQPVSLGESIKATVMQWCSDNGGFPIAFICALDFSNSEGRGCLAIAEQDEQPTHRSLGLAAYLDAWYRDNAAMDWTAATHALFQKDDDDDE